MFGIRLLRPALWTLSLLACFGGARAVAPDDPVMDLRTALRTPVRSPNNPDDLEFRRRNLTRRIDAMNNVADLGQALLLQEWHVEDQDERVARINHAMRMQVVTKFETAARKVLRDGSQPAKESAARLIGDLGIEVRGIGANWGGAMRPLAPDIARLFKEPREGVRVAAAEAMGKINPENDLAIASLSRALTSDTTPVRRAAAAAFAHLIKRSSQLAKSQSSTGVLLYQRDVFRAVLGGYMAVGSPPLVGVTVSSALANIVGEGPGVTDIVVTRDELQTLVGAVVPLAGRGARDADPKVRRNSLDMLHQAATSIGDMVADPRGRIEFPPEGRKPNPEEARFIAQYKGEVAAERLELLPLAQTLRKQADALRATLADPVPAVRLEACDTMIEIGLVRVKLQRRVGSIPPFTDSKLPADQDPILALYKSVLPQLEEAATDPALPVRQRAVEAAEVLGADVVLAVATLERALTDRSRFVRWAAIRAMGRLTPEQGEKLVPTLSRTLRDPDIDLRMTTAATLERYGAHARAALPELRRAVLVGDLDMRQAATNAILAMGTDIASEAIPTFIQAVDDPTSTIRRGAAEALAQFGSAARDAIPALTRLEETTDDPDERKAATFAILKILEK